MSTKNLVISDAGYGLPYLGIGWVPCTSDGAVIYAGKGRYSGTGAKEIFAAKLSFKVNVSGINSINDLSISLVTTQDSNPGYTKAFLMARELAPSECDIDDVEAKKEYIASATCGLESMTQPTGTTVTYTFDGVNLSNGTYHIYILRAGYSTAIDGFCAFATPYNSEQINVDYIAEYTISYSANGGKGTSISSQTAIEGNSLQINATASKDDTFTYNNFTITGDANGGTPDSSKTAKETITHEWEFDYWTDSAGKKYYHNNSYYFTESTTLYANYRITKNTYEYSNNTLSGLTSPTRSTDRNATYKVTLNPNGGSCNTGSLSTDNTTTYTFANWNSKDSEDGTNYNSDSAFTKTTTVYAKWTRTTGTDPVTLPTPTRNGYDFLGWSSDASDKSKIITGEEYTPNANITLYALWKAKGLIRVRIDGEVREALAYVHHDGSYMQVIPMVHNDNKFKISG